LSYPYQKTIPKGSYYGMLLLSLLGFWNFPIDQYLDQKRMLLKVHLVLSGEKDVRHQKSWVH